MTPEKRLDRYWRRQCEYVDDFRKNQPEIWDCLNVCITAADAIVSVIALCKLDRTDIFRHSIWWTTLDYQARSVTLLIAGAMDEGQALLRMATEAARDIARINHSVEMLDLWLKRETWTGDYKKEFRFDKNDATEKYLYKAYGSMSKFGVHSHISTTMVLKPTKVGENGLLTLDIDEFEVYRKLRIWLNIFHPIHDTCIKTFQSSLDQSPAGLEAAIKMYELSKKYVSQCVAELSAALQENGHGIIH